jgi:5-hydroxyisourate hydrolase-like protein (transthyretin family)
MSITARQDAAGRLAIDVLDGMAVHFGSRGVARYDHLPLLVSPCRYSTYRGS